MLGHNPGIKWGGPVPDESDFICIDIPISMNGYLVSPLQGSEVRKRARKTLCKSDLEDQCICIGGTRGWRPWVKEVNTGGLLSTV